MYLIRPERFNVFDTFLWKGNRGFKNPQSLTNLSGSLIIYELPSKYWTRYWLFTDVRCVVSPKGFLPTLQLKILYIFPVHWSKISEPRKKIPTNHHLQNILINFLTNLIPNTCSYSGSWYRAHSQSKIFWNDVYDA